MQDAGALDRRVRIERRSGQTNGFGETIETWLDMGAVWASRWDVSDSEQMKAAELGGAVTTRFKVRYSSLTETIGARDRLRSEGRVYEVTGVKQIGRREIIEITTVVRTEAGA